MSLYCRVNCGTSLDNLPTMDTLLTPCPYIVHTFLPPKKGQPLNNGQNARPQYVHYSEVPLYTVGRESRSRGVSVGGEGEETD